MLNARKVYYSCISGYNTYNSLKEDNSLFIHILSQTEVSVKPIEIDDKKMIEEKWRYFIENPVDLRYFIWPIDILELSDDKFGLVFTKRAYPKLTPLKQILYDSKKLDWQKSDIKKIIENLLNAFEILYSGGYAYHSFNIEKMFVSDEKKDVLIDFSFAMSRHFGSKEHISTVNFSEVGIEFIPPWISFKERNRLSLADDYYSVSVILFRLMVGRMPYQGRLMDGYGDLMDLIRDVDSDNHSRMFEHYHECPVFIFDKDDDSNSIGIFSNEEEFIERWEDIPLKIRIMFSETFSRKNIELPNDKKRLYSPSEWKNALKNEDVI